MKRSNFCGELNLENVNQSVVLNGWVSRVRDLGHFVFMQMRDVSGVVQIFVDAENTELYQQIKSLSLESCVQVKGVVLKREPSQINREMQTGEIEVRAENLTVFNHCNTLPLDFNQKNCEEIRLKYRYLDLRQEQMSQNIKTRAKIMSFTRRFLEEHNFIEIETPILNKSTPEGASDYLVPSRVHKGEFYALPQSPQLFKQMLMVAGFDRYFQIVKCLRDEDLRSDRQPEFTQIDLEVSFLEATDLRDLMENFVKQLWQKMLNIDLGKFPVLSFAEAMNRFGSDKPDLRNPLELIDLGQTFTGSNIEFLEKFATVGRIAGLKVPKAANFTRKQIDEYSKLAIQHKAGGLAWLKINSLKQGLEGVTSSFNKFLNIELLDKIVATANLNEGDLLFIIADEFNTASTALGAVRNKVAHDLDLIDKKAFKPLWVVDFPMFEKGENGKLSAAHHPFTAPKDVTPEELTKDPLKALANSYDMVINGYEVGGGSVRITNTEMQQAVFSILNIEKEQQRAKFGFLLDALSFGAPPHLGLAFGLDRLTMLICATDNIKDVIAFPKTTQASCLLTQAPSLIEKEILDELAIATLV